MSSPSGRGVAQLRRYRPVCPPKPSDLAQRHRVSLFNHSSSSFTSSALSSYAPATSEPSNTLRRHLVIPGTIKLSPGVAPPSPVTSPTQGCTPLGNHGLKFFVRKKEHPGRRKDPTQSLFINSPQCNLYVHISSSSPSPATSPSAPPMSLLTQHKDHRSTTASKGQRRFSDPDVPGTEEDLWLVQNVKDGNSFPARDNYYKKKIKKAGATQRRRRKFEHSQMMNRRETKRKTANVQSLTGQNVAKHLFCLFDILLLLWMMDGTRAVVFCSLLMMTSGFFFLSFCVFFFFLLFCFVFLNSRKHLWFQSHFSFPSLLLSNSCSLNS